MKIVSISDTHNKHKQVKIPDCDLLIHAGDATFKGRESEIRDFAKWFAKQPAKYLVWIPGNHEEIFEYHLDNLATEDGETNWFHQECPTAHMLINDSVVIEGVKIYGSPVQPWFHDWAWNIARGEPIRKIWDKIPLDTDILVTHGPVHGILDEVVRADGTSHNPPNLAGCEELLIAVQRVRPAIHICGHIHCGYGEKHVDGISYYNSAICDEMYYPSNAPHVIEFNPNERKTK